VPRLPRSNWRGGGSLGQRVVRALFVAGATLATGLISIAFATPASAHASLLKTSPAADSVVRVAPKQVLLTFGESVYVGGDAVQVYDDHLHRVDTGAAGHLTNQGPTVGVALRPALPDGTYTVTWRVTSADTHVVSGGFVFSVGAPSRVIGKVPGLAANHAAAVLLGVSRGVGYAGLIAGPGLLVALYAIWPAGLRERRVLRIARAGGVTILLSATVDLFLQGVYAQGLPLSQMFSNAALSGTHGGRFGTAHLIRQNLALPYCILLRARWAKRLFSPA
jgi:copper transport protein